MYIKKNYKWKFSNNNEKINLRKYNKLNIRKNGRFPLTTKEKKKILDDDVVCNKIHF